MKITLIITAPYFLDFIDYLFVALLTLANITTE